MKLQICKRRANRKGWTAITDVETDGGRFYIEVLTLERAEWLVKCVNGFQAINDAKGE